MAMLSVFGLGEQRWFILAVVAAFAYICGISIYRRFFHPLAKVPGPFLASVTKFYQTYYNRRFYLQIEKLHEKYGPIVRITPNEVHLADAENYDKIYCVGSKYWKEPVYYGALCVPNSAFGSVRNDTHKIRRGALNPMFSRQRVLELEGIVQEKAYKVCQHVEKGIEEGKPVDLHHAFRAVSVDVVSDYAFDRCYHFLDRDDFGSTFFEMSVGIGPALWVFQQFPSLQSVALSTPPRLAPYLSKPLGYVTGLQMEAVRQIEGVKEKMKTEKDLGRTTIFTTLLSPENKPNGYKIPTTLQLKDEAYAELAAASETTGGAMTMATFHVLNNPAIYEKLVAELKETFPNQSSDLPYVELEKLPYLSAVIKEGLRLAFGVAGRLPRVVPSSGATFHGYFIPGDCIVSMSAWMMHLDPTVFPDPKKFDPERWLQGDSRRLDRNLVPFSRGSRQCVGMPLAYTELYVTIGTLFRRFPQGLKVWNTPESLMYDFEDYFNVNHPYSRRDEWLRVYMEQSEK